ncbi:hypothetical protein [Pseudoalteromonas sp. GB56]
MELKRIYLDGRVEAIHYTPPVTQLFGWDSQNQIAFATVRLQGVSTLVKIDLAANETHVVHNQSIRWAQQNSDSTVVYMDKLDRFWHPNGHEDELIASLNDQGSNKRFVIHHGIIYGINEQTQLWSYDIARKHFSVLAQLPDKVDHIADINDNQLLLALRITARKQVIELSLK